MATMGLLAFLFSVGSSGDGIDKIKWLSSKEAFTKAQQKEGGRWVLVYKEWPR